MIDLPMLPVTCSSKDGFEMYLSMAASKSRYLLELHLAELHRSQESFTLPGFCLVCKTPADFLTQMTGSASRVAEIAMPDWREQLVCPLCGLTNRQRLVATLAFARAGEMERSSGSRPRIYLTERVTALYRAVTAKAGEDRVIGSEYLGPDFAPGAIDRGIRHEDVQELSFPSKSFDIVVSCEVFEHVPDPVRGLREIFRVLRPGGELILTVPFFALDLKSTARAALEDGALKCYLPEERHGDPLKEEGALVFTDFGWDLPDRLREAGFVESSVDYFWSFEYGHLSITNPIIRCRKPQ